MASSEILSQTLYSITTIKLDQLDKQKNEYESAKRALLDRASDEPEPKRRALLLAEGLEKLPSMTPVADSSTISLENLKRFILQAKHDPSVSQDFINDYEQSLRNELNVQSEKYRFAELYGKLVNEWISAGKVDSTSDSDTASNAGSDAVSSSGFLPVGRAESHEQRATWEEYVFTAKDTDTRAAKSYLEDLFRSSSKDVEEAFKRFTDELEDFQKRWDKRTHFDEQVLTNCISGLLRTDILTDQKKATLNDFLNNKIVLREIADVLNMRMQTRKSWSWDSVCTITPRRQLNGRYRFYPDEDLLQTLFLYYIGRSWGVRIRSAFSAFLVAPGVPKTTVPRMDKEDARRRMFFLNTPRYQSADGSVYQNLDDHYQAEVLLDQLPVTMDEQRGGYNQGEAAANDSRKSHIKVVQNLLHILQASIIMKTRLGQDITVIRSDFKWFGPSVPHSSIYAVLEFFGVDADWIAFFRKALECPLRFEEDPCDAQPQLRKRGTPLSTPIADFFAESMLFCLDFAVNQKADGARLYRLHDDMWLWGSEQRCVAAWSAITEFTDLMGLAINEEKTGSAIIRPKWKVPTPPGITKGLPKGNVVWGFLKLDAASGRFLLDQDKVSTHIDELRLQLDACKSVFDWIQAWNIYGSRFFSTNFGSLANCYSRAHVDSILQTFQRIQESLFPGVSGGVGARLKQMIAERFGVQDVPDGYLYFPLSLGGLGLQNPFVPMFLLRESVLEDPGKVMDDYMTEEAARYRAARAAFESPYDDLDGTNWTNRTVEDLKRDYPDLINERFFSYDEYTRYQERTSRALGRAFDEMRREPEPEPLREMEDGVCSGPAWQKLSAQERWVCRQHAKDMVSRFGGLAVVEQGLLPMGMMGMLRQSRFKWQG
ncbi:hypothetical protein HYQ45_014218 [Verticillium longisporum]|uniref:Reverse transcriptase domain-containing protein n=2 Tax=Verticillium longisporum TaxID=100787 RepID=A0A8I3AK42_VERLO|nr:hypothetical protein HYQ45_014218 [Verticillium longisporum]